MHKYISFEGVPAAGKSYLTEMVSNHLESQTMFEIVEENPFLEKFYQDPEHWSFQTEIYFLANRYMQLKQVNGMLNNNEIVVSDYHILKNLIFAEINLVGEELKKYRQLFNVMIDGFAMPNIIVYVDAEIDEISRRIKIRNREIEKDISTEYLEKLIQSYKKVLSPSNVEKYYPGTKLIRIDANRVDFIKDKNRLPELYDLINNALYSNGFMYQEMK